MFAYEPMINYSAMTVNVILYKWNREHLKIMEGSRVIMINKTFSVWVMNVFNSLPDSVVCS